MGPKVLRRGPSTTGIHPDQGCPVGITSPGYSQNYHILARPPPIVDSENFRRRCSQSANRPLGRQKGEVIQTTPVRSEALMFSVVDVLVLGSVRQPEQPSQCWPSKGC